MDLYTLMSVRRDAERAKKRYKLRALKRDLEQMKVDLTVRKEPKRAIRTK
jgi:hypothetical protein